MEAQPVSEKRALLKSVFGYEGFRPGQEQLIDALLQGRDAMGIMPTGAGKSMCYQLPRCCCRASRWWCRRSSA